MARLLCLVPAVRQEIANQLGRMRGNSQEYVRKPLPRVDAVQLAWVIGRRAKVARPAGAVLLQDLLPDELSHVGRRPVREVPARRPQSDHDRTRWARYDAETGAKKRTRVPPGYITSAWTWSLPAGLPISTKLPLSADADARRHVR